MRIEKNKCDFDRVKPEYRICYEIFRNYFHEISVKIWLKISFNGNSI
jgi:hypothetical protein